jgi:hypothetical protein
MPEIFSYDPVAANNNSAPPNGWPENMAYSEVNDTGREMMATLARFVINGLSGNNTTAGAQPAYTLISGYTLGAYAQGQIVAFVAHATSTGAVTLNVDGLGASAVYDSRGVQLGAGDIVQNGRYIVLRTASAFRIVGQLSAASVQALAVNTLKQSWPTGGSANAYTVTTGLITAYAEGQILSITPSFANTGAATVNVDGLGAEPLVDFIGGALISGDIGVNEPCIIVRVSGSWRVIVGIPDVFAPETAQYIVAATDAALTAERVATDTATITWDFATGGQAKASVSTASLANIGAGLQTVYIPASAMAAPASGGGVYSVLEMAGGGIYPVMSLSTTGFPTVAWQWEMPKGWNEGTLTYRVLWSHPATTTNFGVLFTLQAFAVSDGEAMNGTYTASTSVTDTGGSTDFKYTTPTSAAFTVDGTPAEGDLVVFRLIRNPADVLDTLAVDARIHGVALFYTTNANTDA